MKDAQGKPGYRRLGLNLVEYDNSGNMVVEPVSLQDDHAVSNPVTQGTGMVRSVEFIDGQPFRDVQQFDFM